MMGEFFYGLLGKYGAGLRRGSLHGLVAGFRQICCYEYSAGSCCWGGGERQAYLTQNV